MDGRRVGGLSLGDADSGLPHGLCSDCLMHREKLLQMPVKKFDADF